MLPMRVIDICGRCTSKVNVNSCALQRPREMSVFSPLFRLERTLGGQALNE